MNVKTDLSIDEWIQYGVDRGYCSNLVCVTHEGIPLSEEEEKQWDEGYDPCSLGIRIWQEGEVPANQYY